MKKHSQKINDILKLGFSKRTLSVMTESQISALHNRLVESKKETKEEVKPVQKTSFEITGNGSGTLPASAKGYNLSTKDGKTVATPMEENKTKKSKTEKNPWAICTSSLSDEFGTSERSEWSKKQMNKYERCVKGVKKTIDEGRNPYEFLIEEKMAEIVERHISPKISKADLLEAVRNKMISEQPAPTTKPKPGTKPSPATDPNFDPFINPDPDDQPEANSPEPTTKPKPGTKPAPTTNPDFDPFISPDPDDQPEAKGLDSFMKKVKLMGLIKKHTKRK
jgi:hypothetical protein